METDGLFEVPEWGCQEGRSTNTCTIDGFLATLLCAKWKDPFFIGRMLGDDAFTNACRDFVSGKCKISERKNDFIEALYPIAEYGDYDLFGDEQSMIHEKAKRQSEIVVTASCVDCYQELIETRNQYIVRSYGEETLQQSIHATIAAPEKDFCDEECTKRKEVSVSVSEMTWMLPIDLSQATVNPVHIGKLPPLITVGGVVFQLGGVTIFINSNKTGRQDRKKTGGHYSCVMWHDMRWLYYDGMALPKLQIIRNLSEINRMKENSHFSCKCAYYFRVSD